jgi:hypothetical protein
MQAMVGLSHEGFAVTQQPDWYEELGLLQVTALPMADGLRI